MQFHLLDLVWQFSFIIFLEIFCRLKFLMNSFLLVLNTFLGHPLSCFEMDNLAILTAATITLSHVTEPKVPYASPPPWKTVRAVFRYVFCPEFFLALRTSMVWRQDEGENHSQTDQGRIPIPRGPRQFRGAGPPNPSLAPLPPLTTPLQQSSTYFSLTYYLDL